MSTWQRAQPTTMPTFCFICQPPSFCTQTHTNTHAPVLLRYQNKWHSVWYSSQRCDNWRWANQPGERRPDDGRGLCTYSLTASSFSLLKSRSGDISYYYFPMKRPTPTINVLYHQVLCLYIDTPTIKNTSVSLTVALADMFLHYGHTHTVVCLDSHILPPAAT